MHDNHKTATKETIKHYRVPDVMETILRVSNSDGGYRWAVGDSTGWYSATRKLYHGLRNNPPFYPFRMSLL